MMTQLLISVRSFQEADLAVAANAELLDIKEPRRGALGAADPDVVAEILATAPSRLPVSIAGGELREVADWDPIPPDLARFPDRVLWSKVGFSGCDGGSAWCRAWTAWCQALPASVAPVAVIYADRARAHSPPASEILNAATDNGCGGVLIDTFDKSQGGLLDQLSLEELTALAAEITHHGLWFALAGSLDLTSLPQVLSLRPRYVAVRTAVCQAGRTESLDPLKVAHWVRTVQSYDRESVADVAQIRE